MKNGAQAPPPFKTWRSAIPIEGLIAVNGHRGKGKSHEVWAMTEELHESRGLPVIAFRFPQSVRRLLPDYVQHVKAFGALSGAPPSIVVCDEMAQQAHARDHATNENKEWVRLMAILRQYHHLVFAIYQHSRQMELSLAMDSDLLMFKQPSQLHIRFARQELRPEVEQAFDHFAAAKGEKRRYVFMVDWHGGRRGFVKGAGKPSFWSEELSTAYALAAAGG